MSKKIGIVGFYRNDMFGVHADYFNFVEEFGTPVILPRVDRLDFFHQFKGLEGLVLPGGADIDPARYAANPLHLSILRQWYCNAPDPVQEYFDTEILPGLAHAGFPVFGICRGLQTLNVHYGGTLKNVDKHPKSKEKTDLVHEINVSGEKPIKVNSFHHQAVNKLADCFEVLATSQDGVVEAIKHVNLPVVAVQYHPERSIDPWTHRIVQALFG